MFRRRKRRQVRLEEEDCSEKEVVFVYRGKPNKFIPKIFTSERLGVPREIPHVTIHPSVRKIPRNAFRDHECLLTAIIPSTVKRIDMHAFLQCQSLVEVFFHPGLQRIGHGAFLNTMLVTLHLPQSLKEVGDFCFSGCRSLRIVSTPKGLKTIGSGAFLGCVELTHFQFQEGLKRINSFAFSDCKSLSVIALPKSLKTIEPRAFLYCTSLVGVEFLSRTKVKLGFECFYGCRSLANLHLPDSIDSVAENSFDECDSLGPDGERISRLRRRFETLPVHETCYYSEGSTVEDLISVLESPSCALFDPFRMTPFHVLVTSTNPRLDFLECLLDRYPIHILSWKDLCGKTMMDYLLMLTSSSKAVPLIQLVLHRAIIDPISTCDQGRTWKSDLSALVEALSTEDDINSRRFHVLDFYKKAGYCIMVETKATLELATWKLRLNRASKNDAETSENYRAFCQYQCGAEVVIENVSGYLWDEQAQLETAKSNFPLFAVPKKLKTNSIGFFSSSAWTTSPEEEQILYLSRMYV